MYTWQHWKQPRHLTGLIILNCFTKCLFHNVPVHVIKLIMNWYAKTVSVVRWNDCYSSQFITRSGVRQGGVLSPVLFTNDRIARSK